MEENEEEKESAVPTRLGLSLIGEKSGQGEDKFLFTTDELFSGKQEIQSQHQGEIYWMRITRNRKLILTK